MDNTLVVDYSRQILNGLEYLHSGNINIVHMDIKPRNLLLKKDSRKPIVKIADVDNPVIRELNSETRSMEVVVNITKEFMSPELLSEISNSRQDASNFKLKISRKTDIWSFGCVVLAMLGKTPRDGTSQTSIDGFGGYKSMISSVNDLICERFLEDCFRIENQRPTASELLKHEWLVS